MFSLCHLYLLLTTETSQVSPGIGRTNEGTQDDVDIDVANLKKKEMSCCTFFIQKYFHFSHLEKPNFLMVGRNWEPFCTLVFQNPLFSYLKKNTSQKFCILKIQK